MSLLEKVRAFASGARDLGMDQVEFEKGEVGVLADVSGILPITGVLSDFYKYTSPKNVHIPWHTGGPAGSHKALLRRRKGEPRCSRREVPSRPLGRNRDQAEQQRRTPRRESDL